MIFCHGPKMFRKLCQLEKYNPDGCSTHPHNIYIQLLSETGLIGTFFILSLFSFILFIFIYNIAKFFNIKIVQNQFILTDPKVCLLASFFVTLWPFVPTGNFFANWTNCIMYLPLGFYLYEITKKNN